MMDSDSPLPGLLTTISAAAAERNRTAGDPGEDWGASATSAAAGTYIQVEKISPVIANEAIIPISQLVRASAAEARTLVEQDPAHPNLERRCWIHCSELSILLAIFARDRCKEYVALRDSMTALTGVMSRETVIEVWRLLRDCSSRARPPALAPRRTPTDNREYYVLRTRSRKTEPAEKQKSSPAWTKNTAPSQQQQTNPSPSILSPPPRLTPPSRLLTHGRATCAAIKPPSTASPP